MALNAPIAMAPATVSLIVLVPAAVSLFLMNPGQAKKAKATARTAKATAIRVKARARAIPRANILRGRDRA